MGNILKKLSSRKLWAMVAGVISGLAMVFGLEEGIVSNVSGAVVALGSIVAYIVAEGKIDAAAVKNALEAADGALREGNENENE